MLYYEFIENTGAKDDVMTLAVFSGLEHIYMQYDAVLKDSIYKYGKRICDDLHEVAHPDRLVVRHALYHGIENPFTYTCGYCNMPADSDDCFCRNCGSKFVMEITGTAGEKERKEENAEQKDSGSGTEGTRVSEA